MSTRIIDLGNGYGRLEGYGSRYASLTFPLTLLRIRKLHAQEVISDDEARAILLEMGLEPSQVKWAIALGKISTEQWKARVYGYRTV